MHSQLHTGVKIKIAPCMTWFRFVKEMRNEMPSFNHYTLHTSLTVVAVK